MTVLQFSLKISKCCQTIPKFKFQSSSINFKRLKSSGGEKEFLDKKHVEWLSWTENIKETARKQNKLLLLSIGRDSIETKLFEAICASDAHLVCMMNEKLLLVKVDKDERPDLDNLYSIFMMRALKQSQIGYPRSVWLTPDLLPLNAHGLLNANDLKQVVERSVQLWDEQSSTLCMQSAHNLKVLRQLSSTNLNPTILPDALPVCHKMISQFRELFDIDNKGFHSGLAKCLPPVYLLSLMNCSQVTQDSTESSLAIAIVRETLRAMISNSIYDQVHSGFFTSSLDSTWRLPKFEKLLYDQCLMLKALVHAFVLTKEKLFHDTAIQLVNYMKKHLKHSSGGYCSMEFDYGGLSYAWSWEDLEAACSNSSDLKLFAEYYSCQKEGNVSSSTNMGDSKLNILFPHSDKVSFAKSKDISVEKLDDVIESVRSKLSLSSVEKTSKITDQRYITAWNCMLISALSYAGKFLNQKEFFEEAKNCVNFIRERVYDQKSKRLPRVIDLSKENGHIREKQPEQLEDYACLVQALLDLMLYSENNDYLEWVKDLQAMQNRLFWDNEKGGYHATLYDDPTIIIRVKPAIEVCNYLNANSISASNLVRLQTHFGMDYGKMTEKLFSIYMPVLSNMPVGMPGMFSSYLLYKFDSNQVSFII